MFENFADQIEITIMNVAITAHQLHHRGRPSVTHILASLEQLRCRGRSGALSRLFARANVWLAQNQLPPIDPFVVAHDLPKVLATPLETVATLPALTPRTRTRVAAALTKLPIGSLTSLSTETQLGRAATLNAAQVLAQNQLLQLEIVRGETFYIATSYLQFVESLLPVPVVLHHLVSGLQLMPRSGNSQSKLSSPFQEIYDPFGYRVNERT